MQHVTIWQRIPLSQFKQSLSLDVTMKLNNLLCSRRPVVRIPTSQCKRQCEDEKASCAARWCEKPGIAWLLSVFLLSLQGCTWETQDMQRILDNQSHFLHKWISLARKVRWRTLVKRNQKSAKFFFSFALQFLFQHMKIDCMLRKSALPKDTGLIGMVVECARHNHRWHVSDGQSN